MDAASQLPTNGRNSSVAHPFARGFHMLFKLTAVLYFFTCKSILHVHSFVTNFIVLLVMTSADFWVVKNVTGRLLVGLRWWNDVSDEGSGWRFETLEEGQRTLNGTDKVVFWAGLVGNVSVWILYTLLTLLRPSDWEYLLICAIALVMGCSNLYGYFRCSKEARNMVRQYAQQAIVGAATSTVTAATAAASTAQSRT